MTRDDELFAAATRNRLLAADMFASLDQEQWAVASLCSGWTVREVAAHLIPHAGGVLALAAQVVRYRGDFDRMADASARRVAQRPTAEIVTELRSRAGTRLNPPGIGAAGPMTDTVVHLRDAAVPLGLAVTPDRESWLAALDFLVSRPAARGFVPRGRLRGLHLRASDAAWEWASGEAVITGDLEALAMAVAGRGIYLRDLSGPGVNVLRARI